jgi:hypothetical protein
MYVHTYTKEKVWRVDTNREAEFIQGQKRIEVAFS